MGQLSKQLHVLDGTCPLLLCCVDQGLKILSHLPNQNSHPHPLQTGISYPPPHKLSPHSPHTVLGTDWYQHLLTYTMSLQSSRTDFLQRILPVLSICHCWNWLLLWLNLFRAKFHQREQSGSEVHSCFKLRSKSVLSFSPVVNECP